MIFCIFMILSERIIIIMFTSTYFLSKFSETIFIKGCDSFMKTSVNYRRAH